MGTVYLLRFNYCEDEMGSDSAGFGAVMALDTGMMCVRWLICKQSIYFMTGGES